MKRVRQTNRDELRAEYKVSDFPGGFVRGKYASRLRKSSNIVVLRPEVAEAFPNEEAVNKALLSLIDVAQKTTRLARRSTGRAKKLRAGQLGVEAMEKAMKHKFLLCVDNEGYEASLEVRKLQEKIPDKEADRHNQVRIIDESGEDYLYPSKFFASVRLPMQTKNRIVEKAA